MKICPRCKEPKEDEEYHRSPTTGRLSSYCHPCRNSWNRDNRAAHKEVYASRDKKWKAENREKVNSTQYAWRKANPEAWAANCQRWASGNRIRYEAEQRTIRRQKVFEAYGGFKCVCCGETEPMFLTIDHIENDGNKHRKELKSLIGKGGTAFFTWLVRNEFPPGFQVLCRNCNWGKHANGGVCPHMRTSKV